METRRADHRAQWLAKEVLEDLVKKEALEMQGSVSLLSHHVAEVVGIEVSECSSSEDESSEDGSGGNSSEMAVTAAQDTTEDNRVEMAASDGLKDFESAIAAVQHSRTAELRWSALVDTARSCNNGKDRMKTLRAMHKYKEDGDEGWKGFWEKRERKD